MRRKVVKAGGLRLSPNEEAQLLKEEHERRRKLRLQQVREQERNIALQIRQDVKQRRDEHLNQLAEELEMDWRKTQDEKIKALEKLYLSSLQAMGEGHREAEENEPDWETLAKQAEERKQTAKKRFKEALKEQKNQKDKLLREQARRSTARRHAVEIERERAAKVASLPPPPPHPFEDVELKRIPSVKVSDVDRFLISRHHLFDPHVDREMNTEQPDARLLAKEEAKQTEELQNEKERERREQLEKACLRGKHALKMVRLARDKEKLMKELEQLQNMDLTRRRQIVAQMPPQLFEPGYRRMEIKEEWQTELEYAFEDIYAGNMKMRGDLILHLDPQPLPAFSDRSQDDELELSQEPEFLSEDSPRLADELKEGEPSGSELEKTSQPQARLALKKLLNKIRSQKDSWTSRCESELQSDMGTIESGTISSGRRKKPDEVQSASEPEAKFDPVAEDPVEILDQIIAENMLTKHSQEQATKIRKELGRSTQSEEQQQRTSKEQKLQLETDFQKAEGKHQGQDAEAAKAMRDQECQTVQVWFSDPLLQRQQEAEFTAETATEPQESTCTKEDDHLKRIHDCQQRLLLQNRIHQDSVDEARRRLEEYHHKLKQRYRSVSLQFLGPPNRLAYLNSIPEPSSRAHGVDSPLKITLTAYEPSKNDLVQELVPLEQKNQEQRLEVSSEDRDQPSIASESQIQVNQNSFQSTEVSCSLQDKEKLGPVGTSVMESLEFQRIPGSSLLKSEDTSAITQPVTHIQNVRLPFPADDSSGCSEALLSDKSVPLKPLAEKSLLPTFLKHQDIRQENRLNAAPNQTHLLPFRSLSSLPSTSVGEAESIPESLILRNDRRSWSSCSDVVELRDRLLASSESIEVQQEHLKELQKQLDEQREALLSRQKVQEDLLLQKHALLKQQMEHQQEALKEIIKRAEQSRLHRGVMEAKANDFGLLTLLKKANDVSLKQVHFSDVDNSGDSIEPTESFQSVSAREQNQRLSKPPLAKVKPGLDLEQHELSVIPELDTPRSGRLSSPGYKEWLTPKVDKLLSSKSPSEAFQEEPDLLRISIDSDELNFREGVESDGGSRYEELLGKAGGLYSSVCRRKLPGMKEGLPNFSADAERILLCSDPSLRPNSQVTLSTAWSPGLLSTTTSPQQVACGLFSSSALSTAGFTSNYHPDRSLSSTESCSAKERPRYFSSPANMGSADVWEPSVSLQHKHDEPSDTPSSHLTFEKTDLDESKIQQIVDKYIKGFTWSPLGSLSSSREQTVGLDTTDIERHFPNFHRELFQPLEPSSNFDRFSPVSPCGASNNSKELIKVSDLSGSRELTASTLEERSNGSLLLHGGSLRSLQPKERTVFQAAAEELFEHLPLENTLHKFRESSGPLGFKSEQDLEISQSIEDHGLLSPGNIQCEELGDERGCLYLCPSTENFHSLRPAEDLVSIAQMVQDGGPRESTLGRTEFKNEDMGSNEESWHFLELPTLTSGQISETVPGNGLRNEEVEVDLSQGSSYFAQEQSFLSSKATLSSPPGINANTPACLAQTSEQESVSKPDRVQEPNVNVAQADISDSYLLHHKLPDWETLTGRGILEEPELTLVSSNDISTAESELLHSDLSEVKSCPKSRGFFSLNPEVDEFPTPLDCLPGTKSPQEDWDQKTKPDGFAPAHRSLQESFLQRKKDFIERSSKRVEKLKNRKRSSEKPQPKESQLNKTQRHKQTENLTPGAAVHPLKKMEVKVCSTADRKAAGVQMHQRTSRLYNNLAEVKNKKEEKDRRESYARNRERAKEFQKKTLEKLRARKAHVKI